LQDIETKKKDTFIILGTEDSDVEKNIISFQSPIAKGIIGKKVGEECELQLPEGVRSVIIESIEVYRSSGGE